MVNDQATPLSSRERRKSLAAAAVVVLILLIGFWPGFEKGGWAMDEGMVLVYPELVAHGQLPYRDFETFYGPANPYVLAGAYSIFGTNIFTERAVGLLYRLLAVIAIFALARRWGTTAAAGCAFVAGALLITTQLIASGWIAAVDCVLIGLWILSSELGPSRYFFAGLLGGLALLYRPDLGPALVVSALPFLWRVSWRIRAQYGAGLVVALLPLAVLTLLAGITNVWENLFLYPVVASNPGRRLPLFSAEPYALNLLVVHVLGAFVILTAAVLEWRTQRGSVKGRLLLSIALLSLILTPQATQRLDLGHLLFAGLVSLPFLAVALASLIERAAASRFLTGAIGAAAVVALITGLVPELGVLVGNAFASGLSTKASGAIFVEQGGRSFPFRSPAAARDAAQLFEQLQMLSKPGERLFVGPADLRRTNYCDTFIYHLFPKLPPATYFLEMNPFSANRPGSRLTKDVASADWLVLNRAWDNWREPNRSGENGENAPNEVVQTRFAQVGEYGPFVLFRRKSGP